MPDRRSHNSTGTKHCVVWVSVKHACTSQSGFNGKALCNSDAECRTFIILVRMVVFEAKVVLVDDGNSDGILNAILC